VAGQHARGSVCVRHHLASNSLELAQVLEVSVPAELADMILRETHRVIVSVQQLVDQSFEIDGWQLPAL
jgi:hypothetical protein